MIAQAKGLIAIAAIVAVAMLGVFFAGKREGQKALLLEQNTEALTLSAVVVKADSARVDSAAAETRVAVKASIAAQAELRPVRQSVAIVSDSQVSIDSAPPVLVPPKVIQLIGLSNRVQVADSVTKSKLILENAALRIENGHLKERITLLEERVELIEPGRCGMKCGIAIGATAVLTLIFAIGSIAP